nr:response regulator [uncultured Desulfobulbus sp.]
MHTKILLIDDDTNLLKSMQRNLRRDFKVLTATSGPQGIELLRQEGPFAVLVSDLQMPQMDGIEVLRRARHISPETVRILLTGHTDQDVAIKATNTGKVFRFLTKPCDTQTLLTTLQEASLHYHLVNANQEMIEETLVGVVGLLSLILGQMRPEAQATTNRLKRYCLHIARESGFTELWLVEMAAMLSCIGYLAIPPAILHAHRQGALLLPEQKALLAEYPGVTLELLSQVPGFEEVIAMIGLAHDIIPSRGSASAIYKTERATQGASILRTAMALDEHLSGGLTPHVTLEQLARDHSLESRLIKTCQSYLQTMRKRDTP